MRQTDPFIRALAWTAVALFSGAVWAYLIIEFEALAQAMRT